MTKPPPLLVEVQDEPQRGDETCGKIILTYRDQRMVTKTVLVHGWPSLHMPETFDRQVTVLYASPVERERLMGRYLKELGA